MAKYVPPHKRGGAGCNASSIARSPPKQSRRRITNASADTTLFCDAFTKIRCINLKRRPEQWEQFLVHATRIGPSFVSKVERFEAVDGQEAVDGNSCRIGSDVALHWDTTQNAIWDRHVETGCTRQMTPGEIGCALSHVALWRELVSQHDVEEGRPEEAMLILEDDAAFLHPHRRGRFNRAVQENDTLSAERFKVAFRLAWDLLPGDWDIFYLGLSDRGDRMDVAASDECDGVSVQLFSPSYGFRTHAYAIKKSAAHTLLDNLPVVGPVDVWLADNSWFGLRVYCAVVANDGWRDTGANLISQNRVAESTIGMSSRDSN